MENLNKLNSTLNYHKEQERLDAVSRYKDFHINREKDLQDIVMLASYICDSPIALATLMDSEIQWIKAKVGIDVDQMPVKTSFCVQAIKQDEVIVVEDALLDNRFSELPVVTGSPNIRFYAAAILKSFDGHNVGTLCVYDVKPKILSIKQKSCLEALSKQVSHLMELDLSMQKVNNHIQEIELQNLKIKDATTKLIAAWDSSTSYHLLIGKDLEVLAFNKQTLYFIEQVWGKKLLIGDSIQKVSDIVVIKNFIENFQKALSGEIIKHEELIIYPENIPNLWWDITYAPAFDQDEIIIGVSFNAVDINDRKLNEEKINAQNARLIKIAQIQSHEYRAPVSAILGVMELIKEENYEPNKEYLLLLEEAVKQLDEKIHSVVNYSNQL